MIREPEVFGGARCERIASLLGLQFTLIWIFSVCSDERIPAELERRLIRVHAAELPARLIILGDFPSIPPEHSPASFEAIRLIAEAANYQGTIQVCWINGETINLSGTSLPPLTWHEFLCDKQRRVAHIWSNVQPAVVLERDVCAKITQILGRQPGIRLSDDGLVEALDLTDGEAYCRSLAAGLSQKMENQLWSLIKLLSNLRELRAGFAGLRAVPDLSDLEYLEKLDLRGNPRVRLEYLSKIRSLKKLNAAACELDEIPSGIEMLPLLQTLLLHKNRIQKLSTVKLPPLIERLSLYRNQIRMDNLEISTCLKIKEINIGANPLQSLTIIIPDEVVSLLLRLRHVRERVRIVQGNNLDTCSIIIHYY